MRTDTRHAPRFEAGAIYATPGAHEALQGDAELGALLLTRHVYGDFGDVCEEDRNLNVEAVKLGGRILSVYKLPHGPTLWIITEADRASTTLLLPSEY